MKMYRNDLVKSQTKVLSICDIYVLIRLRTVITLNHRANTHTRMHNLSPSMIDTLEECGLQGDQKFAVNGYGYLGGKFKSRLTILHAAQTRKVKFSIWTFEATGCIMESARPRHATAAILELCVAIF